MNVEKGVVQMDLRGQYANKEMFFEHKFKELIHEDGTVSIQELAEGLRTNPKFFSSDKQVLNHIDKLKESGWLFEPRIGVYRRQ
jgi:hypothetical protein